MVNSREGDNFSRWDRNCHDTGNPNRNDERNQFPETESETEFEFTWMSASL